MLALPRLIVHFITAGEPLYAIHPWDKYKCPDYTFQGEL